MKLIVGLGNPGDKYKDTRHNVGFMVVDKLAHELGGADVVWETSQKLVAEMAKTGEVVLAKPTTFMNASGVAVRKIIDFYKMKPEDVWVIHDDLDLPLGKIRIRVGGASAGHHGIDSIIKELGSDKFVRVRLGIGKVKSGGTVAADRQLHQSSVIRFVLSKFGRSEAGEFKHLVAHGVEAVRVGLFKGIDRAMNRFN
ncbi:aminoacyl-tRNA hydrolase [Candidatus Gottesmanbacteria bacterium]|nr:aminoacyl-tRNA hydrolase [Candidatus Gottesmanbacteria bacterium]